MVSVNVTTEQLQVGPERIFELKKINKNTQLHFGYNLHTPNVTNHKVKLVCFSELAHLHFPTPRRLPLLFCSCSCFRPVPTNVLHGFAFPRYFI